MRIAIPTDDGRTVANHFGRAMYFMIVEIEDGKEVSRKLSENLHAREHGNHEHHGFGNGRGYGHEHGYGNGQGYGHEHGHGHEEVFASVGEIEGVVAVRIGPHMFEDLKEKNIRIYLVRPGTSIDEVVSDMIAGKLRSLEYKR